MSRYGRLGTFGSGFHGFRSIGGAAQKIVYHRSLTRVAALPITISRYNHNRRWVIDAEYRTFVWGITKHTFLADRSGKKTKQRLSISLNVKLNRLIH
jgi:hypothetical protein